MNQSDKQTSTVKVFIDREKETVVASIECENLFSAYESHLQAIKISLPQEIIDRQKDMLAIVNLHLACQPPDLFTAWTLNLIDPICNIFIAGDNNQFQITTRASIQDVKTVDCSRLYLEAQRPRQEPHRSVVAVEGSHIIPIFEQFFSKSDQIPTRLFKFSDSQYAWFQGMPNADTEWLHQLNQESAQQYFATPREQIEHRDYAFHCGCNLNKITSIMYSMFHKNPDELFGPDDHIETYCPRCGTPWIISRQDFHTLDN